jgi:hypothetical protein
VLLAMGLAKPPTLYGFQDDPRNPVCRRGGEYFAGGLPQVRSCECECAHKSSSSLNVSSSIVGVVAEWCAATAMLGCILVISKHI